MQHLMQHLDVALEEKVHNPYLRRSHDPLFANAYPLPLVYLAWAQSEVQFSELPLLAKFHRGRDLVLPQRHGR